MLKERAKLFFVLLNELYKISAQNRLEDIVVAKVPHMEQHDADSVTSMYESKSRDIILEDDNDYSNLGKLRGILNGE